MKSNDQKKEKKRDKMPSGSPKKMSNYQQTKITKQDTILNIKLKSA